MKPVIEVRSVSKTFVKKERGKGLRALFPKKKKIKAVDNISFEIKEGEFVAYVGANGSGKSTTIKMLSGILVPDKGEVNCIGFVPWKQREKYVKNIGIVFGQKSLLFWDLPVIDSLLLYKDIYGVSDKEFEERLELYDKMLGIKKLLEQRVRKLSFGERMRCELAASLLHKPKLLFLDEPTVGMDVVAKQRVREFLKKINEKEKITIILTTHDMGDVEALCERVILIDKGKIIYDGELENLKKKYFHFKRITVRYSKIKDKKLAEEGLKKVKVEEQEEGFCKMIIDLRKHKVKKVVSDIMKAVEVIDLTVEDPELEEIVAEIYRKGRVK